MCLATVRSLDVLKKTARRICIGTAPEHVKRLPDLSALFNQEYPLTAAAAFPNAAVPAESPFNSLDLETVAATIRCRLPKRPACETSAVAVPGRAPNMQAMMSMFGAFMRHMQPDGQPRITYNSQRALPDFEKILHAAPLRRGVRRRVLRRLRRREMHCRRSSAAVHPKRRPRLRHRRRSSETAGQTISKLPRSQPSSRPPPLPTSPCSKQPLPHRPASKSCHTDHPAGHNADT